MLEINHYKIKVLDLIDMNQSMKYNPFSYVHEAEDILKLIDTIMANTSNETKEDFWIKAERLLYQALMAAVFYEFPENEKNLGSVVGLLSLMKTSEDDESYKNPVDVWFEDLQKKHDDIMAKDDLTDKEKDYALNLGYAVNQYNSYKLAAGKTAKSILISCAARLAPLNIPKVKNLLSSDELELENLGREKTALFIIIPDTDRTYNFIASIMYTQLFNRLCTIADKEYGGRLPIHVRCLLDEFANVGKIPYWEILITTIRSREISAAMVLQTKSQLKAMYKDHAETIIGNCDYEIFLGGKEKGTLKEIAESLGKMTINDFNTSNSRGTSESKSINYSKLGRELMSYDELTVMNRKKCVVQLSGVPPFFSEKYDITTHPMYRLHANGNKDEKWFVVTEYIERQKKRKTAASVTMKTLVKRCPTVKKIKATRTPLVLAYEGEEDSLDIV
jgi:type IV secretion system protein VirD4